MLLFACLLCLFPRTVPAVDPDLRFTQISPRNSIVDIANAGDGSGRLFLVEQSGRILINEDGQDVDTPFLDIRHRVASGGNEQGLLSVDQSFGNHNGGRLQFGPDGMLNLGIGDGGEAIGAAPGDGAWGELAVIRARGAIRPGPNDIAVCDCLGFGRSMAAANDIAAIARAAIPVRYRAKILFANFSSEPLAVR